MIYPKLCVPFRYRPEGGVYSFIRNLIHYLERRGISYTHELDDSYDILLAFSFKLQARRIFNIKKGRADVKVVQRVDGSTQDYGRLDDSDQIQSRVNLLADVTIFQSHYAKFATREKFQIISQDGPVIYNAVDTDLFNPSGEKQGFPFSKNVCHVSFSTNPLKGAAEVYKLAKLYPNVGFVLCGYFSDPPPLPNILILGHLSHENLVKIYRSCDVFFFPSENEACPNVVLEALASGLPVLYKNSGATAELVGNCGFPVTHSNFLECFEYVMDRRTFYSQSSRQRAIDLFSPDIVFPQYLQVMANAERRPLPNMLSP